MITHNESSSTSEGDSSISDNDILPVQLNGQENLEVTQVEFEAYPPADEDWSGVRFLLDSLFQGINLDIGYFSQTLIDNFKVGTVIKGADIEVGEDDPVFAVASLLPLQLFKDQTKLDQLVCSLCSKCEDTLNVNSIRNVLLSSDTAFLINAKFSNLPLQITAQLYKALKMELITERKENPVYDVKHLVVLGKSYHEPEERKNKKARLSDIEVKYQSSDLESLSEVALHKFSWKIEDETLAPVNTLPCDDAWQGYRTLLVVSIEAFLNSVDKIIDSLNAET